MQVKENIIGLCLEIQRLALEIEEHDVFVEYSPHVESLSVRVYKDKWKSDGNPAEAHSIYLSEEYGDADKDIAHKLVCVIEDLKRLRASTEAEVLGCDAP